MKLLALPIPLVLVLAGCSAAPVADELPDTMPPLANRMQEGYAPTPFSAEELRAGIPEGCRLMFEIETPGAPTIRQEMHFLAGTEEVANLEIRMLDAAGTPQGPAFPSSKAWTELQSHASFPASQTVLTREPHTSPLGTIDCWVYTVSSVEEDGPSVSRYWFDPARPGPPIELVQTVNGELVSRMVMVEDRGR